jgi:hypothetical protein
MPPLTRVQGLQKCRVASSPSTVFNVLRVTVLSKYEEIGQVPGRRVGP